MDKNLEINPHTNYKKHRKTPIGVGSKPPHQLLKNRKKPIGVGVKITKAKPLDLPYIKEKIKKYWLDGRNVKAKQFFVVRSKEGKLIGFIRYIECPTFYEPSTLGVDYYWRGRGIGSMLFEHVLSLMNKDKPIYILTHIPEYFKKYGFEYTDNYPPEIEEKIQAVCRLDRSKLHVMSLRKNR